MLHALADPILRFLYHSHHVYCPKSFCSIPHTLILIWNAADPCLMPGMCHNAARGQVLQFRLTFHTYACKNNRKKPNMWVRKHHGRFLQHENTIQHIHSESILQWFGEFEQAAGKEFSLVKLLLRNLNGSPDLLC